MNIGPTELIIILFTLAPLVLIVWGIIDAANRPNEAWVRSGQNKALWITLQAVSLVVCSVGWIISVIYFAAIRPRVAAAQLG